MCQVKWNAIIFGGVIYVPPLASVFSSVVWTIAAQPVTSLYLKTSETGETSSTTPERCCFAFCTHTQKRCSLWKQKGQGQRRTVIAVTRDQICHHNSATRGFLGIGGGATCMRSWLWISFTFSPLSSLVPEVFWAE